MKSPINDLPLRPMSARYHNNGKEVFLFDGELAVTVEDHGLGPWASIVRKDHENKEWLELTGHNSYSMMCSERITNACVEGDVSQMLSIALAVKDRRSFSAKRCAVQFVDNRAEFWSPRNSTYRCSVPLEVADRLAATILKELKC